MRDRTYIYIFFSKTLFNGSAYFEMRGVSFFLYWVLILLPLECTGFFYDSYQGKMSSLIPFTDFAGSDNVFVSSDVSDYSRLSSKSIANLKIKLTICWTIFFFPWFLSLAFYLRIAVITITKYCKHLMTKMHHIS